MPYSEAPGQSRAAASANGCALRRRAWKGWVGRVIWLLWRSSGVYIPYWLGPGVNGSTGIYALAHHGHHRRGYCKLTGVLHRVSLKLGSYLEPVGPAIIGPDARQAVGDPPCVCRAGRQAGELRKRLTMSKECSSVSSLASPGRLGSMGTRGIPEITGKVARVPPQQLARVSAGG